MALKPWVKRIVVAPLSKAERRDPAPLSLPLITVTTLEALARDVNPRLAASKIEKVLFFII